MNVNELKSAIGLHGGMAPTNRFKIEFVPPVGENPKQDLTLFCESTTLPGSQITTFEYPYGGMAQSVKVPNGYMNSDITFTFNLTNDYFLRSLFDDWRLNIISAKYQLNYPDKYETDIKITTLDQTNKETYEVKLYKAYPITVNEIALNNASQNEIAKLAVTFTYIRAEDKAYGVSQNKVIAEYAAGDLWASEQATFRGNF